MRILQEFPKTMSRKGKMSRIYPWDAWMDGKVRQIYRHVDFAPPVESMRQNVLGAAKARNGTARTHKPDSESLVFQFRPNGQDHSE